MSEQEIQEQFKETMRAIAKALDELFNPDHLNKTIGFALLVFPYGCPPDARTNYISNGCREDMLNMMKEFIARAEGKLKDGEQLQ